MDKLTFEGLQPEIFFAQQWFADFTEAYADVLNDRIRYPIHQLENIRNVTELDDPYVVMQTLKQIGFDLPIDFIRHNLNRLTASIPQLVLYAERSGCDDYSRTLAYIFGRSVDTTTLYTEDYTNFYTQPYGPLQVDGGEWYKTTHIELGMQMIASDYRLLLPRGKTIKDRFLDAFHEFAPWNVVVERFHFNVDIEVPLFISGRIMKHPKRYIDVGIGELKVTDLKIVGPTEVWENTEHQYELQVTLENGSGSNTITTPRRPLLGTAPFGVQEATIRTFETLPLGNQTFSLTIPGGQFGYLCYPKAMGLAVFTDTNLGIPGGWDGASWPFEDIGVNNGPIEIQRTIGDTTSTWYLYRTDFDSLDDVTYEVVFENPTVDQSDTEVVAGSDTFVTKVVTLPGTWTSNKTGLVDWDGSTATFGAVGLNTDVVLFAEYEGRSTSLSVAVRNDASNVQSIAITGPDEVRATETATYVVTATTIHGDEVVDVPITTRSVLGLMTGNLLTVHQIDADGSIYLSAEYKLPGGQVLKATKKVKAVYVDPDVHLTSLEIVGPAEFWENEIKEYTCIAHFSDNSQQGVLAVWDSGCGSVYITPSGELYAQTTESDMELTLRAKYQYKQVVMHAELPVKFRRRTVSVIHTEILGPNTVIESTQNRYVCSARFSDGSTGYVEADWSSDKFYIDSRGILEVGSVGNTPVNLQIKAVVDGRNAIKQLVAVNTPVTLDNILVLGPDNLREGSTGKYTAYAHYSNGRDIEVQPTWSVKGDPSWVTVTADGLVSFADPREGIVELVARYELAGRTYEQGKPIVLVPNTRLIEGLLVSGPNTVVDGSRVFLTATAVYNDGSIEIVSPLWEVQSSDPLNDPEPMADIVSPGVLQGRSVERDTKVVAIARYFKEIAEFELTVQPYVRQSPDKPISSRIIGPAAFYADQRGSFAHAIVFEECAAELLVSSDWTIDVDPDVATIDSAGFVDSRNGKSTVATITSTYQCGTYTVVDSILVNIIGQSDVLRELVISGPDTVIGDNLTLYTAELFRTGEPAGEIVQPTWSIVSPDGRATINGAGQVYVVDATQSFSFIIKAVYQEGFEKVEATKEISVIRNARPILGLGPIGVRNDPEIGQYLTTELPSLSSGQRFTLTASSGQYMYFCYPASLGLAMFRDVASNFEGGWDGASWPDDGGVGDQYGPIAVQRQNELGVSSTWYLYRTDFEGIGTLTYEVTFGN